jgi:hypothetical protein
VSAAPRTDLLLLCSDDIVALMTKRVYDIAGCNPSVKVHLNGNRIAINSFDKYVGLYLKKPVSNAMDDEGNPLPQGECFLCLCYSALAFYISFFQYSRAGFPSWR